METLKQVFCLYRLYCLDFRGFTNAEEHSANRSKNLPKTGEQLYEQIARWKSE